MASRNPFRRAYDAVVKSIEGVQAQLSGQPSYKAVEPSAGIDYMPKHGRVAPRWTTGEQPNTRDIKDLYFKASTRKGIAVTISGVTEGTYPGKEGQLEVTLAVRINAGVMRRAIENPKNRTVVDVMNEISSKTLDITWQSVSAVSILDKE